MSNDQFESFHNLLNATADVLVDVNQLLEGWHADGTAWSEWDESVRDRCVNLQIAIDKALLHD